MKKATSQRFVLAAAIYTVFAVWLFGPYMQAISGLKYFFIVNCILASIGVYILSLRWTYSFCASLLAGAVYGFGPFAISFLAYHPFAGVVFAILPFTFLPAAFINKWTNFKPPKSTIAAGAFCILPFAFTMLAFEIAARLYLVPVPLQTITQFKSFMAIIFPFFARADAFPVGFFHLPLAALVIGLAIFIKNRRIGSKILILIALTASFYKPILNVPPVFWLSIPVVVCSVMIAAGFQAIIITGKGDWKWIAAASAVSIAAAVSAFILAAGSQDFFIESAKLHTLAALALLTILFITRAGLALHKTRLVILLAAVSVDIIITAVLLMRSVF